MPGETRSAQLADILTTIRKAGYHYDLAKSGASANPIFPPPTGSKLNCRSAAWVFLRYAQAAGITGLQAVYFSAPNGGYLIQSSGIYQTLSDLSPQIQSPVLSGWEFENHYRVKDPQGGVVYDPTFCTASNIGRGNPVGILASSEKSDPKTFTMVSVYGTRYQVTRKGGQVTCQELNHSLVAPNFIVDDTKFGPATINV